MTTPTGTISLNDVNVELGLSGTTTISMNQANVRTLAGVGGSGTIISMNDLRGKSNRVSISYTFSSSTANASLNISAIGGYIAGKSDITVTINSGVYLYATSTGNYGLNLTGGTTGDTLTIVNNGFIMGQGGAGGSALTGASTQNPGGPALNIGTGINATINNTNGSAYIGGGGGGGGQSVVDSTINYTTGGGGAGGGAGGSNPGFAGGVAGGIGASGGNGNNNTGGGGGRIFPGTGGAAQSSATLNSALPGQGGGSGGSGGAQNGAKAGQLATSGAGGSANAAGGNGSAPNGGFSGAGGGGGGWGASGGSGDRGGSIINGGPGGKAVNLNGKSVTWVSGNTTRVYGAVS